MAPLGRALEPSGVTLTQFGVLEALLHLGPMCQRELGRKLLTSNGNVTTVVTNLEKHGLVRRDRQAEDKRYVTVQLTPAGRDTVTRLFPEHLARLSELMRALSPTELEQLAALTRKLGRAAAGLAEPPVHARGNGKLR